MSNDLSRLEAVMGIQIVSVLADSYSQLATSSGVEVHLNVPKGAQSTAFPNTSNKQPQYVKDLISMWSSGHSHRPSTWGHLLNVLKDIGFMELSQQIDAFMKGQKSVYRTNRKHTD